MIFHSTYILQVLTAHPVGVSFSEYLLSVICKDSCSARDRVDAVMMEF